MSVSSGEWATGTMRDLWEAPFTAALRFALSTAPSKEAWVTALGAAPDSVIALNAKTPGPEHLDFLGLMQARGRSELVPDAVVTRDGQPLVYLLDVRTQPQLSEHEIDKALRHLALRADAPFAAVVLPGVVRVFALGQLREHGKPLLETPALHPGLLARLAVGDVPTRKDGVGTHEMMLELLTGVSRHLIEIRGLQASTALALVGRALFIRFLADRGILPASGVIPGVSSFTDCFATPEQATATCQWLDETFNGDLLELPERGRLTWFQSIHAYGGGSPLKDLTAILRGDKPLGDGAYQTRFSWSDLHFAYLPVGLLSQVYEEYAHRFEGDAAREDSVYYTPRHIAEYVVDHALGMLGEAAHRARVLDPAAGGCVFLLAAFRRLVQARWRATGKPPTTATIRSILNTQLVGIDKNPAARQLSALALYLTALELDPAAAKLHNLKFDALQGRVLLAAEDWIDVESGLQLGSLSQPTPEHLVAAFDVVLGNPPWTSNAGRPFQRAIDQVARAAMQARGIASASNPDGVPDLPFLWQATLWARPGGVIALALHGRLLIKTTRQGNEARLAVFRGLDVQYVVNGLELRNTRVWPSMTAPFCLLFAHNHSSTEQSRFFAITPREDVGLNREGRVRIDSKDMWTSDPFMVGAAPALFKILAKGNALDVELIERIQHGRAQPGRPPRLMLSDYVESIGIRHGHGYQRSSDREDASHLAGLPMMPAPPKAHWSVVPVERLSAFDIPRLHRVRDPRLYLAPLLLVRKSPSSDPACPQAMLSFSDLAYSESYIGYSLQGIPDAESIAVYLWSLLNSRLFLYYVLMTSSMFGCERSAAQKSDLDAFPVIPFEALSDQDRGRFEEWAATLHGQPETMLDVDSVVERIYGLSSADRQLVSDRLAFSTPFSTNKRKAVAPPTAERVAQFAEHLTSLLAPFTSAPDRLAAVPVPHSGISPWRFLSLRWADGSKTADTEQLLAAVDIADAMDCSLVESRQPGTLQVGILNQARFWTLSAARSYALDLIKRDDAILSMEAP